MKSNRILLRKVPAPHENIYGYLAQLALLNHLRGSREILSLALGQVSNCVTYDDVPKLADFCRLSPEQLAHCSGLVVRQQGLPPQWQVNGQLVSKRPFLVGAHAQVCPECLREEGYVRGLWSLSLYTACGTHGCALVDTCQKCNRKIGWQRHSVEYCPCGHRHSSSVMEAPGDSSLVVAELMEVQAGRMSILSTTAGISNDVHAQLAQLSLDGICKTIWFIGECLPLLEGYARPASQNKLSQTKALSLIGEAVTVLSDWPCAFAEKLNVCRERNVLAGSGAYSLTEALLGPVERYMRQEMRSPEFQFIRSVYAQHVRGIWNTFGRRHRRKYNDRQLELDFGGPQLESPSSTD